MHGTSRLPHNLEKFVLWEKLGIMQCLLCTGGFCARTVLGFFLLASPLVVGDVAAADLHVPPSSASGEYTVSYSENSYYYVSLLELEPDDSSKHIRTDSGTPVSGSISISKPNGTYRYRLRMCEKVASGVAGNCTYSPVLSVTVSRANVGDPVAVVYEYDALGRLVMTRQDGSTISGYCYDDAGNRTVVSQVMDEDPCDGEVPPENFYPREPTGLIKVPHQGNGYRVLWDKVDGATHYRLYLSSGSFVTTSTSPYYTPSRSPDVPRIEPVWIAACNGDLCSGRSYFHGHGNAI